MGKCSANNILCFNASAKNMMTYNGRFGDELGKRSYASSENGIETCGHPPVE
jgi:hypothetical protein